MSVIPVPHSSRAAVHDVASARVSTSEPIAVIRRRPRLPRTEDRTGRRLLRAVTGARPERGRR